MTLRASHSALRLRCIADPKARLSTIFKRLASPGRDAGNGTSKNPIAREIIGIND